MHEQHSVDCHRKLVQTCWENWFKLVHTAQTSSYWLCMHSSSGTHSSWMGELVQTAKTSSYHEQHSVDCHRFHPCRDWIKLVQTCWENWFKLVHTAQTSSYWLCMSSSGTHCENWFKLLKPVFVHEQCSQCKPLY